MRFFSTKNILTGTLLSVAVSGPSVAGGGVCEIKGMDLVMAETRARGNGYSTSCQVRKMARDPRKRLVRSIDTYIIPGTRAKLGCKGRSRGPNSRKRRVSVVLNIYGNKALKGGWKISDVRARGGPEVLRKSDSRYGATKVSMKRPGPGQPFDFYITRLYLKHPNKSCANIPAVLTDAFGR